MTAITIELPRGLGKMDIPLATARDLRLAQHERWSFERAWTCGRIFQHFSITLLQAECLWELVAFDPSQQTSEFETLLELEANCLIGPYGTAWVEYEGQRLRFTPAHRWCYAADVHRSRQYLHLIVSEILGQDPTGE